MYDVIIIGKGPAGISASLYIKRANLSVLVIGKGIGALEKANKIENYYGITANGKQIYESGINQAKKLKIEIKEEEVLSILNDTYFTIITNKEKYIAKAVLLATGTNRNIPKIKGMQEFEGRGISYCAICDGFLYKDKKVAVLGSGDYAMHEAKELIPIVKSVTILTNGKKINIQDEKKYNVKIDDRKIKEFIGEKTLNGIIFEQINKKTTDEKLEIQGIFVAEGVATSVDFARKLGAKINNNEIKVNEKMETNIPGLYAAGDCTGGLLQISKAVYEGAKAGIEIIKFIREKSNS